MGGTAHVQPTDRNTNRTVEHVCLRLLQVSSPASVGPARARGASRGARIPRRRHRRRRLRATCRHRWHRSVVPGFTVHHGTRPAAITITPASAIAAAAWCITIAGTTARDAVRATRTRTFWSGTCCMSAARRRPSAAHIAPSVPNTSAIWGRTSITGTSLNSQRYPVSSSVSRKRIINTAGSDSSESARSRCKSRTVFLIGSIAVAIHGWEAEDTCQKNSSVKFTSNLYRSDIHRTRSDI